MQGVRPLVGYTFLGGLNSAMRYKTSRTLGRAPGAALVPANKFKIKSCWNPRMRAQLLAVEKCMFLTRC